MTPIFGLDGNLALPPFSALLSLLLVAGVDALGLFALRVFPLGRNCDPGWLRYQAPVIGAAMLSSLAFPLALADCFPRPLAVGLAMAIAFLGVAQVVPLIHAGRGWLSIFRKSDFDPVMYALALLVICYGLLALCPITEADALDYHVGVALEILNFGAFPARPEWFHSRLAGSGEVLIAIGLAIGAEQFGSLLQLCGLYAVLAVFVFPWRRDCAPSKWLALAVLSTPVFVAWVASPKPMLLPGAMTTFSLILAYRVLNSGHTGNGHKSYQNAFLLICLLTMTAATMKLNFMLSGGVVGGYAAFLLFKQRQWRLLIGIGSLMFCILIMPFAYWKWLHFGGSGSPLEAFPGDWPGTSAFESMLKNYRDSPLMFPISLLVPSSLGTFSTILGVGLIYLLTFMGWKSAQARGVLLAAVAVSLGGLSLGQRNARFFLEPFYWILIVYRFELIQLRSLNIVEGVLVRSLIALQWLLVSVAVLAGLTFLLPGALTPEWRKAAMLRSANGYDVMKWADKVLPPKAVVITYIRSMALSERPSIPNDWRQHVDVDSKGYQVYSNIIYSKQPSFILLSEEIGNPPPKIICASEIFAGPFESTVATRNPFNAGAKYSAWLLKIDLLCLKEHTASVIPTVDQLPQK